MISTQKQVELCVVFRVLMEHIFIHFHTKEPFAFGFTKSRCIVFIHWLDGLFQPIEYWYSYFHYSSMGY